jgi:tetratricopeptide (TPR) repeat protein
MTSHDCQGLPLTTASGAAVRHWDALVRAFLAHGRSTPEHLGRALTADPDFALAWAAKGLFYLLLGRAELVAPARDALAAARGGADRQGLTPRERAYIDALAAWLSGRPSRSVRILEAHLSAMPEDALAMKLDHAIRFVLGDRKGMERMMRTLAPAYDVGHPHEGYARGCLAFALEEGGHYEEAEREGRAALERAGDDAWGLHAVAHVYDMTARNEAGIAWLTSRTGTWEHCNNFGYHVWWHLGLFHLDRREYERVLELYDTRIRAEHTDDYRDIANAASMLVRLELEGVGVGDRWEELAELAAGRVEDGSVIFADLHYLLALNGGGRTAEAETLIARIAADAQHATHDMHEVAAVAGLPTAVGLAAFRAGNYRLAFEKLRAARPRLQRAGGSHAQRDVFSRLLIEAGIRARRWGEAEAELRDRAFRRGAEDGFTHRRLAAIARARQAALATG